MKFILAISITCFCSNLFAQQWFSNIYSTIPTIPFDLDIVTQTEGLMGVEISIEQYNEIIGDNEAYIFINNLKKKESAYGSISDTPDGLVPPIIEILGRMNLNANYKTVLFRIKEDPMLEEVPIIVLCSFDDANKYLSGILLRLSGSSSYSGKVTQTNILQVISYESGTMINEFFLRSDGYFELVSSERRDN